MKTFLITLFIATACIAQSVSLTPIKESVKPKYASEATAFKCDIVVKDTSSTKAVKAIEELKSDKQVVGKNPNPVYAIEVWRKVDKVEEKSEGPVNNLLICSGSFADKADTIEWLKTLMKKLDTVPDMLPEGVWYTLHTCYHSPEGKIMLCTREVIIP